MIEYGIEFNKDYTIVTFYVNRTVSVKFEGRGHEYQAMEFIRINMVHMGQIGE